MRHIGKEIHHKEPARGEAVGADRPQPCGQQAGAPGGAQGVPVCLTLRSEKPRVPSLETTGQGERCCSLPPPFRSPWAPRRLEETPGPGEGRPLYSACNSDAAVSQKRPRGHPRKNVSANIGAPCGPVKLTDNMHHHSIHLSVSLNLNIYLEQKFGIYKLS